MDKGLSNEVLEVMLEPTEAEARKALNMWCLDHKCKVVHWYSSTWCEYPNGRSYWAFVVRVYGWCHLRGKYGVHVYENEVTLVGKAK